MVDRPATADYRRLLVISYHHPPDGSVGGLRWAGYSKYLAKLGWEVHVITASEQAHTLSSPGVIIHTCPRRRTLNDVYNTAVQRRRLSHAHDPAPPPQPESSRPGLRPWRLITTPIRNEIATALVFPDYARGWILRSAWAARRLLARYQFDAVITSGPPHAAHLAGFLATLGKPGLLRVDMRDPWASVSGMSWGAGQFKSNRQLRVLRGLEAIVLGRATQVISNTKEFARALQTDRPDLAVAYFPNGIDVERLPAPKQALEEGLIIAYVGTLYLHRNVFPVLQAMRELFERHPEARANVRLRVAGTMEREHEEQFREQLAATGVAEAVEVLGVVPQSEALELVGGAHLALVLAQNQPIQIPAKLYESVALKVPTMVIAERSSASAREADRIGAATYEAHDVSGIRSYIENLWSRKQAVRITPAVAIDYESLALDMDRNLRTMPSRPIPVTRARAIKRMRDAPDSAIK